MKILKKFATLAGISAFWLTLWCIAAWIINNPLIFPSPLETVIRLCELVTVKEFWIFTSLSLIRTVIGIALAVPSALITASLCSYSTIAKKLFDPAVLLMRSTPVVSFILIAIFIFERDTIPSVITFIMIFPVLYRNIYEGINQTPRDLLEMASVFRIPWALKIKNIYFPSVAPYLCSSLTTSIGLAMKAGIAAEVVAYIPQSIGKKLSDAKSYMEPADLFAWTAVIIILSLLLEKAVGALLFALKGRKRNA